MTRQDYNGRGSWIGDHDKFWEVDGKVYVLDQEFILPARDVWSEGNWRLVFRFGPLVALQLGNLHHVMDYNVWRVLKPFAPEPVDLMP